MNLGLKSISTVIAITFAAVATADDKHEKHEIIEKVMKEGLKGDECPLKKTINGAASDEEIKKLAELIATLKGTKAPVGDQAAYDEKVTALIAAAEKVAGGAKDEAAI